MVEISTQDRVWLVDLENIGTKMLYQHVAQHREDEYVIFHSDATASPGTILDAIPEDVEVSFVDCRSGGNNAMDFCICAMAGILAEREAGPIRILSDDKDYDPVLYMLHHKGVRIARESVGKADGKQPDKLSARESLPLVKAIRGCVPRQYQDELIEPMLAVVSRAQAHEILQAALPQKLVTDIYKKLKKHIPKERV